MTELNKILAKIDKGNISEREFEKDVEEFFDFAEYPKKVKECIHTMAWNASSNDGYREVFNNYWDLIGLTKLIVEQFGLKD